jgi:hypothetical protein
MKIAKFMIASVLICYTRPQHTVAQTAPPITPPSGHLAVPDYALYYFLFDHISNQDQLATQQLAAGKPSDDIKNYFGMSIGLAATDFQILHDTALPCRSAVAIQDDAALSVIKDFRSQLKTASAAPGTSLPAPPAELSAMQQQRNEIVLGCVDELKQKMTPAGFQKVDQYVHQDLAKHVKIQQPALIRKAQH